MTIGLQIDQILDTYVKEVDLTVIQAEKEVASKTVSKLKKDSPRGKGKKHYADGWRQKKDGEKGRVVYNAAKPGLTHLLNNGHATAGGTGRVQGDDHITDANDWASEEFVSMVEEKL